MSIVPCVTKTGVVSVQRDMNACETDWLISMLTVCVKIPIIQYLRLVSTDICLSLASTDIILQTVKCIEQEVDGRRARIEPLQEGKEWINENHYDSREILRLLQETFIMLPSQEVIYEHDLKERSVHMRITEMLGRLIAETKVKLLLDALKQLIYSESASSNLSDGGLFKKPIALPKDER